jgi:replication-associated recombination protein RarA
VTVDRSKASECGTKQRHPDQDAALAHCARMLRNGAARLVVYRCKHCRAWHIGHRPRPRKNRR